jgi:hypothetical protein
MHIGQHAGCSPDILKNWPLATEQEYRSLLEELNTIGYENIKINHIHPPFHNYAGILQYGQVSI